MHTSEKSRFRSLVWLVPVTLVALIVLVMLARWMRQLEPVTEFISAYPGHTALPENAPVGIPTWLAWQHFLNAFFLVLIVRSGLKLRKKQRPDAFFTPRFTKPGTRPKRIGIDVWFHVFVDFFWVLNGAVFIVLLFVTGQWMRIVPTSWEVWPNAVSVALQFASLDWPTESGWVNYNALQLLFYFAVVFIAAPIAIITGYRLSTLWPQTERAARLFPEKIATVLHYPTMLFFVFFTIVHVTLVFATGVLRNLNNMYAGNDGNGWAGLIVFAISLVAMIAGWLAVKPAVVKRLAGLVGEVTERAPQHPTPHR